MNESASWSWIFKMAWRDSRRNRGRLLLFLSSMCIGIAALVAINSFGENLQKDINRESKNLLGADILFEGTQPAPARIDSLIQAQPGDKSSGISFISMVLFPKGEQSRLSFINAIEGEYPLYGELKTKPAQAGAAVLDNEQVLVDQGLMEQYQLAPGDSVKIGHETFAIGAGIIALPGQAGISSAVAPSIFIPMSRLAATGLIQQGSRVEYKYYLRLPDSVHPDTLEDRHRPLLEEAQYRATTVEDRQASLGRAFSNLNNFLNLVGFIALILGCLGVASAVHIYLKEKRKTVAILRCLGMRGKDAFRIFLVQIMCMGLIGSLAGVIVGSLLQKILPIVLGAFLPLQQVTASFSWSAAAFGLSIGLAISYLFSLIPLSRVKLVNPLNSIRDVSSDISLPKSARLYYVLIALFLFGFAFWQTRSAINALASIISLAIIVGFLALVAFALMKMARRFFPKSWSYEARQGLANLFRPNNQTLILSITIGLGTTIILSLFLTQELLLQQVQLSGSENQPNTLLFDIQPDQIARLSELTTAHDMPIVQSVPLVSVRVESIAGYSKKENKELDREERRRRWVYNREYRVTYRDTLSDTETIASGAWPGQPSPGKVGVSVANRILDDWKVKLGDEIVFNVQGALIEAEVVAVREVNWNRLQTNFFVIFQNDVLEKAPQNHVLVSRTSTPEQKAAYQTAVVKQFPNVSLIDLGGILESVDSILKKLAFVIQFMAFFSLLTGLMVLISSVLLSKYQRIREAVLLRTLGASGRQLLRINGYEYLFQGLLAVLTGYLLSFGATWAIARFAFQMDFKPGLGMPALIGLGILLLTLLIGLYNIRSILKQSPLEVLRNE